jgi:hypothetical protein
MTEIRLEVAGEIAGEILNATDSRVIFTGSVASVWMNVATIRLSVIAQKYLVHYIERTSISQPLSIGLIGQG